MMKIIIQKNVLALSLALTMLALMTSFLSNEVAAAGGGGGGGGGGGPPTTPPGGGPPTTPPGGGPPTTPPGGGPPVPQNQMTITDPTISYYTDTQTVTASGTLLSTVGQAPITTGQCTDENANPDTCLITASTELSYDQDNLASRGFHKDIFANGDYVVNPNWENLAGHTNGAASFTDSAIHIEPPGLQDVATSTSTTTTTQAYAGQETYSCGDEISCPGSPATVGTDVQDNKYDFSFDLAPNGDPNTVTTAEIITYVNENFNGPNENSGFTLAQHGETTVSDPYNVQINDDKTSFTLTENPAQPFNTQTFTDVDTVIVPETE